MGMAFIDSQMYIHSLVSIKNLIIAADLFKSITLLRLQVGAFFVSCLCNVGFFLECLGLLGLQYGRVPYENSERDVGKIEAIKSLAGEQYRYDNQPDRYYLPNDK